MPLHNLNLDTLAHTLTVRGLEADLHPTSGPTLGSFEAVTVDGVLTLSPDDLSELSPSLSKPIYRALEQAARVIGEAEEARLAELRDWLNTLRN